MDVMVLAPSVREGLRWQYDVENLGAQWRCVPVTEAQEARALLQQWRDVLLLLPCRESGEMLASLRRTPLLAPPCILGPDAPDGPLPGAELLPSLMQARRQALRFPAMAQAHLPLAGEMAAAFLRMLDVPERLRAWDFLPEMLAWTVVHPPLLIDLQHGLYPLMAGRYGMTAAGVERSLRLCVESTWMHGSLEALERFFGASVDPEKGKPTNRAFLCRAAQRLTISLQRLL